MCISGTYLLRQLCMLPHWDKSCRSNFLSYPVTIYWQPSQTLECQAPGKVATEAPVVKSLVWLNPKNDPWRKWESNPALPLSKQTFPRDQEAVKSGRSSFVCFLSMQHAKCNSRTIQLDNCACCHTKIDDGNQACHLIQLQYADTHWLPLTLTLL